MKVTAWHTENRIFGLTFLMKKGVIPAQNNPRQPEIIGPILGDMLDPDSTNM